MLKKFKKGEMSMATIITIIVVVASFAILLYFFIRLNLGGESEKEICRNSVITRSQAFIATEAIPLNCRTSYLCISQDGSCESMTNPRIEKVKTKDDVYKKLADEMYDCWWMFGEGKLNYVEDELLTNLYCSICSQVGFDDSIKSKIFSSGEIDKTEFYRYLTSNKINNRELTYSQYLFGSNQFEENTDFGKMNLDKQHYIIMGITNDVSTLGWVIAGTVSGLVVVASPFVAPGYILGAVFVAGVGGAGYIQSIIIEGLSGKQFLTPSIIEANSEQFNALECKEIKTLA